MPRLPRIIVDATKLRKKAEWARDQARLLEAIPGFLSDFGHNFSRLVSEGKFAEAEELQSTRTDALDEIRKVHARAQRQRRPVAVLRDDQITPEGQKYIDRQITNLRRIEAERDAEAQALENSVTYQEALAKTGLDQDPEPAYAQHAPLPPQPEETRRKKRRKGKRRHHRDQEAA